MVRSNLLKRLSLLALAGTLSTFLAGYWMFVRPRRVKLIESWEWSGKTLRFRVEAYGESTFVGGAYYDFRATPVNSENWETIMTFRHDDPVPIPRGNVRFVNNEVAYAFMGCKYVITSDSGKTWNLWNAEKDLPGWQCCNYQLIDEVQLNPDGLGRMILKPIRGRRGELPELRTTDFGRHWVP